MKSMTYLNTLLAIGLGVTIIIPASAQDNLANEPSGVCGFTLRSGNEDVYRTKDWSLTNSNGTSDNNLIRPHFWITDATTGRLYGGNGERCGFHPYLNCDDHKHDKRENHPFIISSNGSLTFSNHALFYLCNNTVFDKPDRNEIDHNSTDSDTIDRRNDDDHPHHNGTSPDSHDDHNRTKPDDHPAYPHFYPPLGTTNHMARYYENCTGVLLVASGCREGSSGAFTVSPSVALQMSNATEGENGTETGSGTGFVANTTNAAALATSHAGRVGVDELVVGCGVGMAVVALGFVWL